jgi:hypothetical protein
VKRLLHIGVLVLLLCLPILAREKAQGYCEKGGQTVTVFGLVSTTTVQRSYASCTVTVYATGGTTLSTLYSDNSGTSKANPFTADTDGYWSFYAADGRYDVKFSGGGIATPFTRSDFLLGGSGSGGGGITSLGGLTGATQTFVNDTNVTMTSATTAHTLGWTGLLAVARGGTGAATFTANGVVFGSGTSALGVTAAGAAYQPLRVPAGGGAPAFGALNISQAAAVTGALPLGNGGTGQITATAAFDALDPLTTKGDTLVHNGTNSVRQGIGTNYWFLMADSAQTNGLKWAQITLSTASVTGVLPIANGGTGQTSPIPAFDALSPSSIKGDLIVNDGTHDVRMPVGATDQMVLVVDSTQVNGIKWQLPSAVCRKDTVLYTNTAFVAASTTADVTLFTLGQYEKMTSVTIKHSAQFSDGAGAMSQVTVSSGKAGTVDFYTAATNIGEATAVADTTYLDTALFKSGTMAAAGQAVLAHFIATGADFGTGAATSLTGGSLDIWSCYVAIQ